MDPVLIVAGLVAPALFWIGYTYYKDRIKPEPFAPIGITYVVGIGTGYLGLKAYDLGEALGLPEAYVLAQTERAWFFVYCVAFVGVVEELVKLLPFCVIALRLRHFDEEIDGIVYASVIGLGYATYENLLFLPEMTGAARYGRAFASPLVHSMFSSIWGWTIARAVMQNRSIVKPALIGLAIAAIAHGIYDFVSTHPLLQPAAAIAIAILWIWRIRLTERLHDQQRQSQSADVAGESGGQ